MHTLTHIEGCLRRVRECLFWPRIASDVKDYVSKCDVCLAYRTSQSKEPLLQHEVISRPWAKVAADLCGSNGRPLLVVSDYFSNFIEVSRLHAITTKAVVHELKTSFARFGIPEILVTDNGPQFASNEFKAFAKISSIEWQSRKCCKDCGRNTTHNLFCECELQLQNFTYLKFALVVV